MTKKTKTLKWWEKIIIIIAIVIILVGIAYIIDKVISTNNSINIVHEDLSSFIDLPAKDQYESIWTIKYNSVDLLTLAKLDSMIRYDYKKACDIDIELKRLPEGVVSSNIMWFSSWDDGSGNQLTLITDAVTQTGEAHYDDSITVIIIPSYDSLRAMWMRGDITKNSKWIILNPRR
jgi:hypothetical protein